MPDEKLKAIVLAVSISAFVLLLIISVIMLFRIYRKKKNNLLLEKETMRIRYDQTLLQSKLEIQEETFTYIAREIHDNIGQTLSMARLNLNSLDVPEQRTEHIDTMLGKAIADLRSLSHSLDTDRIRKYGWMHEVSQLFENLRKSGKFSIHTQAPESIPVTGRDKPIILFRMIQEIVNNIVRHAEATEINFHASCANNTIIVEIRDNGKGFDQRTVSPGSGLNNIMSRAAMIGASTTIASEPGKGTQLTITLHNETDE